MIMCPLCRKHIGLNSPSGTYDQAMDLITRHLTGKIYSGGHDMKQAEIKKLIKGFEILQPVKLN
jgi:hypothetical protein